MTNRNLIMRLTAGTMAMMLMPMGAFAAVENDTTITKAEADEKTIEDTEVLYSLASNYSVVIPKRIVLDGDTKASDYTVKVSGDISSDKQVSVAPQDALEDVEGINFYMKDQAEAGTKKADVEATVTQEATVWSSAEVCKTDGTTKNGNVSAPTITAGSWKGMFDFEISLQNIASGGGISDEEEHSYTETVTKEPTCTEAGEKTYTCGCGDSYTETIPATGHNYVNNICMECGETEAVYSMLRSTRAETQDSDSFLGSKSAGLGKEVRRMDIADVHFCDYTEAEGHYLSDNNCWDVSAAQDGSIIAWYENPNYSVSQYSIYIAPKSENVKIQAPVDASYMFAYLDARFHEMIYGLDKVDFSKTTNMSWMFYGASYSGLHLDIDTSNVTDTSYMFGTNQRVLYTTSITFGDKVDFSKVTNSDGMFYNQGRITDLEFSKGLNVIGKEIFYCCASLTELGMPDTVTSIGDKAFSGCTNLTALTIPDTVTNIGNQAFCGCKNLTELVIPNSVTSISDYAFSGCTGLTTLTIPNSVTSISGAAFSGCTGLTALTIPDTVISIGSNAFQNVPHVYYTGSATGSPWGANAYN